LYFRELQLTNQPKQSELGYTNTIGNYTVWK